MAIRQIVKEGDSVLTKHCREVVKFDDRLAQLIDDMTETLHDSGGVGLAAPQVGIIRRVVVIDVSKEQNQVIELVNPVIIESSGVQCFASLAEPVVTVVSCPLDNLWTDMLQESFSLLFAEDIVYIIQYM